MTNETGRAAMCPACFLIFLIKGVTCPSARMISPEPTVASGPSSHRSHPEKRWDQLLPQVVVSENKKGLFIHSPSWYNELSFSEMREKAMTKKLCSLVTCWAMFCSVVTSHAFLKWKYIC